MAAGPTAMSQPLVACTAPENHGGSPGCHEETRERAQASKDRDSGRATASASSTSLIVAMRRERRTHVFTGGCADADAPPPGRGRRRMRSTDGMRPAASARARSAQLTGKNPWGRSQRLRHRRPGAPRGAGGPDADAAHRLSCRERRDRGHASGCGRRRRASRRTCRTRVDAGARAADHGGTRRRRRRTLRPDGGRRLARRDSARHGVRLDGRLPDPQEFLRAW